MMIASTQHYLSLEHSELDFDKQNPPREGYPSFTPAVQASAQGGSATLRGIGSASSQIYPQGGGATAILPRGGATALSTQGSSGATEGALSRVEVSEMVDQHLASIRFYVLESDITKAQKAVKSLVELSTF